MCHPRKFAEFLRAEPIVATERAQSFITVIAVSWGPFILSCFWFVLGASHGRAVAIIDWAVAIFAGKFA
jgi:hypothetical protein